MSNRALPFTEKELAAAKFRMLLAAALDTTLSKLAGRCLTVIACKRINFKTGATAFCAIATYCIDLGIKSDSAMRAALAELEAGDYLKAEKAAGKVTRYRIADHFFADDELRCETRRGDEQTPPHFTADTPPHFTADTPPHFTADTPPRHQATNNGNRIPENESRKINPGKGERGTPPSDDFFSSEDAKTKKLSRVKSPSRRKKDSPPEFEEFWRAYPLHKARGDAERAYARALADGATPQDILLGAMRYAAERDREPDPGVRARFTAHAATWLNRGSWADEPTPAASPATQAAGAQASRKSIWRIMGLPDPYAEGGQ